MEWCNLCEDSETWKEIRIDKKSRLKSKSKLGSGR